MSSLSISLRWFEETQLFRRCGRMWMHPESPQPLLSKEEMFVNNPVTVIIQYSVCVCIIVLETDFYSTTIYIIYIYIIYVYYHLYYHICYILQTGCFFVILDVLVRIYISGQVVNIPAVYTVEVRFLGSWPKWKNETWQFLKMILRRALEIFALKRKDRKYSKSLS